jgi:hypothetical protein
MLIRPKNGNLDSPLVDGHIALEANKLQHLSPEADWCGVSSDS